MKKYILQKIKDEENESKRLFILLYKKGGLSGSLTEFEQYSKSLSKVKILKEILDGYTSKREKV